MALMLTRAGVMSRLGGFRSGAHGLITRSDAALRKQHPLIRSGTVALSAFGFGLLQGKFKEKGGAVAWGLPVDLLCGTAFHVIGLIPFARPYAHHLAALGDGALASFFTTTGYRVGERWAKGGTLSSGIAGLFSDSAGAPVTGGASIADRELASLVRAES